MKEELKQKLDYLQASVLQQAGKVTQDKIDQLEDMTRQAFTNPYGYGYHSPSPTHQAISLKVQTIDTLQQKILKLESDLFHVGLKVEALSDVISQLLPLVEREKELQLAREIIQDHEG